MIFQDFEHIKTFIENQDKMTAAIYIILGKILGSVFLLPAAPLTLLAGGIFGTFLGTLVSMLGNILGSTIAFLIARYLLRDFVRRNFWHRYPKLEEYETKLFENGFWTVLFLRFVPIFPFNTLNYVLGVTDVKFRDFFFATVIGIVPGTLLYVFLGKSLFVFSFSKILIAFLIIFVLVYVTNHFTQKKN